MNDRIRFLRKHFKMTQEEFAAKLGVKRGAIANYEIGRNIPADSVVSLICKVFNVNEEWLRTGAGGNEAAFDPAPKSKLDDLAEAQGLTDEQYILLQKFIRLRPEIRQGILEYIVDAAAALKPMMDQETESERQARLLREEADAVERGGGASSASRITKDA